MLLDATYLGRVEELEGSGRGLLVAMIKCCCELRLLMLDGRGN